jgi:biopolymer transport protein ExbB
MMTSSSYLMSRMAVTLLVSALAISVPVLAEDSSTSLDELLQQVKQGRYAQARENKEREARFARDKAEQATLLSEALAQRERLEGLAEKREQQFEDNEQAVAEATQRLNEKKGSLNELFGHLSTASGDMLSIIELSPVSAQFPGRGQFFDTLIDKIGGSDRLPTIAEIEQLWFEIQREMTESGRVVKFEASVIKPNGDEATQTVLRVGSFNLITDEGRYLGFDGDSLAELARQPAGRYLNWASDLAAADSGLHRFGLDPTGPTGGTLLSALISSPTLDERWHQGGYVGYAITLLGIFAVIIALWRLATLMSTGRRVNAQLDADRADDNNPLGRVLAIHQGNPTMDTETLELKLHEQILKEIPRLEKFQGSLKIIAAVAPLMGLLGTVTGMIITFQAITMYGAGDPKTMASGISSALITTVLGLLVAIPTVLLHTMVASRSRRIIQLLEEQSSGLIAEHTEAALHREAS